MDALVADLRKLVTVEKSLFWLAVIPIIVVAGAAATWALTRSPIQRDGSDLRMETNGLAQAVPLANTVQPAIGNEVVYCDTASLTLLLSHNRGRQAPCSCELHCFSGRTGPTGRETAIPELRDRFAGNATSRDWFA